MLTRIDAARSRGLLVATPLLVLVAFAPAANAFDFSVSGQVDRAVIAADNGEESDYGFVDNQGSNSRFRFTGSQQMNDATKAGFTYEIGLGEYKSTQFDINNGSGKSNDFFNNRLANVFLQGDFGKVSFGKIKGAADGTSEVSYSGTTHLGGGVGVDKYFGGITFLDDDAQAVATVGDVISEFDGISRQNGIRYDSPSLGGAILSASLDNGHAYELAGRYQTQFADGSKWKIALDWLDTQNQNRDIKPNGDLGAGKQQRFQESGGSTAILLPSGLNFALSYKHREFLTAQPDADNYFVSAGYIVGPHHCEVSYQETRDKLNEDSKGKVFGLSYRYDYSGSIQMYASYHLLQLEDADDGAGGSLDAQDINALFAGVRLQFL